MVLCLSSVKCRTPTSFLFSIFINSVFTQHKSKIVANAAAGQRPRSAENNHSTDKSALQAAPPIQKPITTAMPTIVTVQTILPVDSPDTDKIVCATITGETPERGMAVPAMCLTGETPVPHWPPVSCPLPSYLRW